MKWLLTILIVFLSWLPGCKAESPRPFRRLDLSKFAAKTAECEDMSVLPNYAVWIDARHVVVWLITTCRSNDGNWKSSNELVFIDSGGGETQVLHPVDMGAFSRGPSDTILIGRGSSVDAIKSDLEVAQTIPCPEAKRCAIYSSPSGSADSDFALCSTSPPTEHCILYKGLPAERLPEAINVPMYNRAIPKSPYANVAITGALPTSPYARTAWRVSDNDWWFFDVQGELTSFSAGRSAAPVSSERWCPKDSNCSGEVSLSEPKRFLATCVGAHIYTDGDLDNIFGYSRIALFDVRSRRLLLRIDGRAYTSATLSPDGSRIATIHRESDAKVEVKLYKAD